LAGSNEPVITYSMNHCKHKHEVIRKQILLFIVKTKKIGKQIFNVYTVYSGKKTFQATRQNIPFFDSFEMMKPYSQDKWAYEV
jgi:zona occludens toxin (predicted ATPase)